MPTFIITARQLVEPHDLNELDIDVDGIYLCDAIDSECALDTFHDTVPIKVLDDFDISVRTP